MTVFFGCHASRKPKTGFVGTLQDVIDTNTGANVIQVFIGSPYGKMSEKTEQEYLQEAPSVKQALHNLNMKMFVHSPYALNFAKDPAAEAPYWIDALWKELKIAQAMGAEGSVLHMGKAVKLAVEDAEKFFYDNLSSVIERMENAKMTVKLFIETSTGQGTELYPTLEGSLDPLARFFSQFSKKQRKHLGICVDTCHVFAAGYDISSPAKAKRFWEEFDEKIGIEHLGVVHINNSLKPLQSKVDRHAMLLHGKIDVQGLREFARMAMTHGVPLVLETPTCFEDLPVLESMLLKSKIVQNHDALSKTLAKLSVASP